LLIAWPLLNLRSRELATWIVVPYGLYYFVMDAIAFSGYQNPVFQVKDIDQLKSSLLLTLLVVSIINFVDFKLNLFF
jgi:hypothetical protein